MVVDTQLYDTLGVKPNASQREIKQAFQKKARELHPDKNQSDPNATAKFQALNEAYDILKNPNKRREYDKLGISVLKHDGQNFETDFFNDFMNFNPFGFPFSRDDPFNSRVYQQYEQRTKDVTYTLKCNLEDFYNGSVKTLQLERTRICQKCKGKGLRNGRKTQKCKNCNGTGEVIIKQQINPNTFIQKIHPCSVCNGTGEFIKESDKCPECNGRTVIDETKKIQVYITKGMENGEEIVFKGESNEIPNAEPGDFIVTIQENPHKVFKRNFANLMIRKEITLTEALLGVKFPLTHLDGRILIISSSGPTSTTTKKSKLSNPSFTPYEVIKNGCTMVVEGEGMPYKDDSFQKGDLFIYFEVKFPVTNSVFSKEFCDLLEKTLPRNKEADKLDLEEEDIYEVTLLDSNINEFNNSQKRYRSERKEAYKNSSGDDDYDYDYDNNQESNCAPM